MGRTVALLRITALSALLAVLGGCTSAPESAPDLASSESSLGFAWDAKIHAPKQAPRPLRAASWEWPSEREFEERFARWPSEAWSLGVLIGDREIKDSANSEPTIDMLGD